MKRALVVFETAFKYGWQGSTSRILDISVALADCGWRCVLLAGKNEYGERGREPESVLPAQVVRTPFAGIYPGLVRGRIGRRLYRTMLSMTGRGRLYRDPECSWPLRAARWYAGCHEHRPQIVIGMTTGLVGSLVAARLLSERFDVPLVLEFQDPCPSLDLNTVYEEELAALERTMMSAALVITTTRALARHLADEYPRCKARIEPIYMAYPPIPDFERSRPVEERITILHAGTLAGGRGRNVRVVVEALARLENSALEPARPIELVLLGGGEGADEAKRLALDSGIGHAVRLLPEVPRAEALEHMARADILLVVKYADLKYSMQVPGKLFQYLGMGKPVLGIMRRESEAAEILLKSGLGAVFENDDVAGIAGFLEEVASGERDMTNDFRADSGFIRQFSLDAMGRKLDDLLLPLIGG